MPRSARKESGYGIYHVMMRGINRQAIFDDDEDCRRFVHILADLPFQHDDDGMLLPIRTCVIYAWCLMTNHFHLLVMEKDWKIAEVIKSLASSYVYYYNKKNERIGHLFQRIRGTGTFIHAYRGVNEGIKVCCNCFYLSRWAA